jgi:hypothetical protein
MAEDRRDVGLLAVTSADRLNAGWTAALRARERGLVHARSHIERLLGGIPANTGLVTVLDGHPATLGWLGAVLGHRTRPLGVEHFGQTGSIPDLYRHYGIDANAIIAAPRPSRRPARSATSARSDDARYQANSGRHRWRRPGRIDAGAVSRPLRGALGHLQQEPGVRRHPKGSTHNSRTMEHHRQLGIGPRVRDLCLPINRPTDVSYYSTLTGWELGRIPMPSEAEKRRAVAPRPPPTRSPSRCSAPIRCTLSVSC